MNILQTLSQSETVKLFNHELIVEPRHDVVLRDGEMVKKEPYGYDLYKVENEKYAISIRLRFNDNKTRIWVQIYNLEGENLPIGNSSFPMTIDQTFEDFKDGVCNLMQKTIDKLQSQIKYLKA